MTQSRLLLIFALAALVAVPVIFYGLFDGMPTLIERYGKEPVLFGLLALMFIVPVGWMALTLKATKQNKEDK